MLDILATERATIFRRYLRRVNVPIVVPKTLPETVVDTYKMALLEGRKRGYEDGMVDGVELGLFLMEEALDRIMCQSVVAQGHSQVSTGFRILTLC